MARLWLYSLCYQVDSWQKRASVSWLFLLCISGNWIPPFKVLYVCWWGEFSRHGDLTLARWLCCQCSLPQDTWECHRTSAPLPPVTTQVKDAECALRGFPEAITLHQNDREPVNKAHWIQTKLPFSWIHKTSVATPVPADVGRSVIERKLEYTGIAILTNVVKISHFYKFYKNIWPYEHIARTSLMLWRIPGKWEACCSESCLANSLAGSIERVVPVIPMGKGRELERPIHGGQMEGLRHRRFCQVWKWRELWE